jgi:hypothetical protein
MSKKRFNEQMSMQKMYPRHIRLKNGGMVRKKFDDGGIATNSTNAGTNQSNGTVGAANTMNQNPILNALGVSNNFQAGQANIQSGTNQTQLQNAYTGANNAINAQVGLANTFNPQAGQAVNEQNNLAQSYQNTIAGTGPNAAQTQFATNTAQNVANQSAMAAGQRGAAQNVGLLERQAAQQGAQTEQQAAGQAATTQAQQQVAAQQSLANLAAQQSGQATGAVQNLNTAQQNEQNILQGANTAYNNSAVGMQSNLNSTNAATAANNQNFIGNAISSTGAGIASAIGLAHGGEVPKMADGGYAPVVSAGSGGPNISAPPVINQPTFASFKSGKKGSSDDSDDNDIEDQASTQPALSPMDQNGLASAQASGASPMDVAGYAQNAANSNAPPPEQGFWSKAASAIGFWKGGECKGPYQSHVANFMYGGGHVQMKSGGTVPALVSPKEVYLSPDKVKAVVEQGADPMKIGEHIPGQDKVKGKDSKKNDFVPKDLQEGGVVLPLHITQHKKSSEKGREFVKKAVAKHMKSPKAGK